MAIFDLILGVARVVVFVYDVVTFPVYFITQESWKNKSKQNLGEVVVTAPKNPDFCR